MKAAASIFMANREDSLTCAPNLRMKGQVTIPTEIHKKLGLKQEDLVAVKDMLMLSRDKYGVEYFHLNVGGDLYQKGSFLRLTPSYWGVW
jgi:hypothetical protein